MNEIDCEREEERECENCGQCRKQVSCIEFINDLRKYNKKFKFYKKHV